MNQQNESTPAQLALLAANVREAGERVIEAQRALTKARAAIFSAIKQGEGRDFRTTNARINALEERLALLETDYTKHQKSWVAAKRGALA